MTKTPCTLWNKDVFLKRVILMKRVLIVMFLALSSSLCGCNFGEAEMERRMQDALDRGDTDEARRIVNEYYDD